MSRRASVFARLNPGKRRVRFPDEVMFEESIKDSDGDAIMSMLRRASVDIDIDRINMAGMTALHQVDSVIIHTKSSKRESELEETTALMITINKDFLPNSATTLGVAKFLIFLINTAIHPTDLN